MKWPIFLAVLSMAAILGCENGSKTKTDNRRMSEGKSDSIKDRKADPIEIPETPKKNPPRQKLNGGQPQTGLSVIPLFVAGRPIQAEVAAKQLQRNIGLMHRHSLGKDKGMIFVYSEKRVLSFWMRDTLIPLSIAYIRDDGTIVDIIEMEPAGDVEIPPSYPSSEDVRFALEMAKGWFAKHKIKVGMKIVGIEQADKEL